jgi:hypothetical protein
LSRCKNRPNRVEYVKRAELDGTTFSSTEWSDGKVTTNSWIHASYKENGEDVECIGEIKFMFVARVHEDAEEDVIVTGEWYDIVGPNPISRNRQAQLNQNFASEPCAFLRHCTPLNITLVPSDPFDSDSSNKDRLYDILE